MKTHCDCSQNVRAGSFQGVNFRICTKCQYLQWEEHEGLTFIRPEFEFLFELPDTKKHLNSWSCLPGLNQLY